MSFSLGILNWRLWSLTLLETPAPPSPFEGEFLSYLFEKSLEVSTPLTIAVVYFSAVHFINPLVVKRQVKQANLSEKQAAQLSEKDVKRLKPAPYAPATTLLFKAFVLVHNVFLCVYSVWTFFGTLNVFSSAALRIQSKTRSENALVNFVHAACDVERGVFQKEPSVLSLTFFGWWFYVSKFYEVLDTVIILLRGRPSSLLQSYHHAGAMMCMWSGIRYQSPPIWIFIVFNSFIHSLMYFYFTLSCLKIRVPAILKRALTSMQICQFVIGGSLGVLHAFLWLWDHAGSPSRCINNSAQALPVIVNVVYLAPLAALFAAFYAENYLKRKTS